MEKIKQQKEISKRNSPGTVYLFYGLNYTNWKTGCINKKLLLLNKIQIQKTRIFVLTMLRWKLFLKLFKKVCFVHAQKLNAI